MVMVLPRKRESEISLELQAASAYPAHRAPIAQLVEQLICNQWVGSSSLSGGTIVFKGLAEIR